MDLQFLYYINDPQHIWCVCIGVPYVTHIWQPADSSELNSCFKVLLNKAKQEYVRFKYNQQNWAPSDIIPLINDAWKGSFAIKENALKPIVSQPGAHSTTDYCCIQQLRKKFQ
jgi:hypothetical protein